MSRPELGKVVSGQDVIVVRSPNDSRGRAYEDCRIPAKVVKVARVWVQLGAGRPHLTWRMRLDTQDEGTIHSGSNARFVTLEQDEWERTHHGARSVLRKNAIMVERHSPWYDRLPELANFIVNRSESS